MLKQLLNECIIDLTITPDGPVLIKSGMPTISGPDMAFVTTWRNGNQEVYLPGSSLKGVFRSHAERIARTLNPAAACNPFVEPKDREAFCGHVFEARKKAKEELKNPDIYSDSCPICRLFGSTWYGGRLATEDAYAAGRAPRPQQRDGVGIDRFTGGAAHGVKFDMQVITDGEFVTRLHLRNFELWQLGLVGFLLTDLADGLVRIGAAKSRGLGRVRGEVKQVRIDFLGPNAPHPEGDVLILKGLGEMATPQMAQDYDMARPDKVELPAQEPNSANGLRTTYLVIGATFPWDVLAPRWVEKATTYQTPTGMSPYRQGR